MASPLLMATALLATARGDEPLPEPVESVAQHVRRDPFTAVEQLRERISFASDRAGSSGLFVATR